MERQLAEVDAVPEADIRKKIELLNQLAWALSDIDLKQAQALSERAFALAKAPDDGQSSHHVGLAYSLRTRGYLNMRLGHHALGLSQLFEALEIFESLQLDKGLAEAFDHIAGIYFQIGTFPEALDYMYKQLEAAQRVGDKRLIANAYNNLANIYFETGDYERAIETLRNNLELAAKIDYKRIEALSYLNLAETHLLASDYQQALKNARRALPVSRTAGFELFEVYALDFTGKSYLKLGDTAQAINHLEQALALSRQVESKVTESLSLLNLSQAYRDMQQLDRALEYGRQGVTIAQAIDAKNELAKGHLLLSEIYEQQGEPAQALHHFKQHHTFKELVFREKTDERLKVLQVAHDTKTARQEAEIYRLRNVDLKREIAERQRREERLRLLESVVKHTGDGVLVTEAAPLNPPGPRIVYVNQALVTMTGYSSPELIGQNPRLFQGPKTDRAALGLVRQALEQKQPVTVELINYTKAGREAVALARSLQPDVILMDMLMPEMDGPEAIVRIIEENPEARILVLTSFGESKKVSAAVQAGALGYLLKDSSPDDLLHAIRSVYRGNLALPQALALTLMPPQPSTPSLDQLTGRGIDVLKLLAQGQSNRKIAETLSIGTTTVRTHVSSLLTKLDCSNRTQLALFAVEQGFAEEKQ